MAPPAVRPVVQKVYTLPLLKPTKRRELWRAIGCCVRMQEAAVVSVIEEKGDAGDARYIEFKVHRSPTDPNLVLGSWRYPDSGLAIDQSKLGTSVQMEFRTVVDCADQHGIPFVWVNDPDELFPPWLRP